MPAKSKAQQKFFGLVRSVQKGETPKSDVSKSVKKAANSMSKKEVDKFAKTKRKGLPEKITEHKITIDQLKDIIKEAINEVGDTKEGQYLVNAVRGRAAARPRYQNSKYNSVPQKQKQSNTVNMAGDAAWKGRQQSNENPAELDRYADAGYNYGYQKGMVSESVLESIIRESVKRLFGEAVN